MSWFSARILYVCRVDDDPNDKPLYEECIYLVEASDEDGASDKAESVGQARADTYLNGEGETVRWRMLRVANIHELEDATIADGTEVYSRLSNDEPA